MQGEQDIQVKVCSEEQKAVVCPRIQGQCLSSVRPTSYHLQTPCAPKGPWSALETGRSVGMYAFPFRSRAGAWIVYSGECPTGLIDQVMDSKTIIRLPVLILSEGGLICWMEITTIAEMKTDILVSVIPLNYTLQMRCKSPIILLKCPL